MAAEASCGVSVALLLNLRNSLACNLSSSRPSRTRVHDGERGGRYVENRRSSLSCKSEQIADVGDYGR
jgi:hypothetical protein